MKKVSVITVCYNSALTIEDCISSVLNQTYPAIEYIVIDGLSTDNTLSIIKKNESKISRIICEKDKGMYDAINKGIAICTGEIVAILNSDDLYTSDIVIEKVVNSFEKENAEAVYGDLFYVDATNTQAIKRYWKSGSYSEGKFLWGWMPPHPSFFVLRECYIKYGGFNLDLRSAADYELMLRFIHRNKIKLAYLPEVLVRMRQGGMSNSSLRARINANIEDREAWAINNLKPYFFTLFLKPLRKIFQYIFRPAY